MRDTKEMLIRHMKNHVEDGDWTCDGCSFQSSSQDDLINHLLEKRTHSAVLLEHLLEKTSGEKKYKCKSCGKDFKSKGELKGHMASEHKTFKPCDHMNNCEYGDACYFSHTPVREGHHRCFDCGEEFSTKYKVMVHRKSNHKTGTCRLFLSGNCTYGDRCVFTHGEPRVQGGAEAMEVEEVRGGGGEVSGEGGAAGGGGGALRGGGGAVKKSPPQQPAWSMEPPQMVFQQAQQKLAPPSQQRQEQKEMMEMLRTMYSAMMQMMENNLNQ